jgi:hypothetical protein
MDGSDGLLRIAVVCSDEKYDPQTKQVRKIGSGEPRIGDRRQDSTIYAGVSPDTGEAMYTTSIDAVAQRWLRGPRLTHTFNQAQKCASEFEAHGHGDWRVPTKGELNVLWKNRNEGALKGTFNVSGSYPAGWYWSSSQINDGRAFDQRFSDGYLTHSTKIFASSLRCVR